jgi:hypothetical protein
VPIFHDSNRIASVVNVTFRHQKNAECEEGFLDHMGMFCSKSLSDAIVKGFQSTISCDNLLMLHLHLTGSSPSFFACACVLTSSASLQLFNESEAPTLHSLDLTDNPLSAQDAWELASILNRLPSLQSVKVDVPGPLGATLKQVAFVLARVAVINGLGRDAIAAAKEATPLTVGQRNRGGVFA